MKHENEKDKKISSDKPPIGEVYDAEDVVNKFGTYNIQPTADTKNLFPAIAQGLPRQKKAKDGESGPPAKPEA